MKKILFIFLIFLFIPFESVLAYDWPDDKLYLNYVDIVWDWDLEDYRNLTLDDFPWSRSMIGRNGSNIKDIKVFYDFGLNSTLYEFIFLSRFEGFAADINLGVSCPVGTYCSVPSSTKENIKKSLFDRQTNANSYVGLWFRPQQNITVSNSDIFRFGFSIEFHSSQEIIAESLLLHIMDYAQNFEGYHYYYTDIMVSFYDYNNEEIVEFYLEPHFLCYPDEGGCSDWLMKYDIPKRYSEIYRFDITFAIRKNIVNGTKTYKTLDAVFLQFGEFNLFSTRDIYKAPIFTNSPHEGFTCDWYDVYCHIKNGVLWVLYEMPGVSDMYEYTNHFLQILSSFWYTINQIFIPLDIIPSVGGLMWSEIVPVGILLGIAVKLLLGGS